MQSDQESANKFIWGGIGILIGLFCAAGPSMIVISVFKIWRKLIQHRFLRVAFVVGLKAVKSAFESKLGLPFLLCLCGSIPGILNELYLASVSQ